MSVFRGHSHARVYTYIYHTFFGAGFVWPLRYSYLNLPNSVSTLNGSPFQFLL